jgi:murein DD-endopeptidase MepM/ murein hydrolase activator NlpD
MIFQPTYRYNPDKLVFEHSTNRLSLWKRTAQLTMISCLFALGAIITPIGGMFERQFLETQLQWLNHQLELNYSDLSSIQGQLNAIQDQEGRLYCSLLGISPLDPGIWEGGIGGNVASYPQQSLIVRKLQATRFTLHHRLTIQEKRLNELNQLAKAQQQSLLGFPLLIPVKACIVSGFGHRCDPYTHHQHFHAGIDFAAPIGTPIHSAGRGYVKRVGYEAGYGLMVEINHENGYVSKYAHLSKTFIRTGQRVERGERIANVGNTGWSTGPHLHYEIIKDGEAINPLQYLMLIKAS